MSVLHQIERLKNGYSEVLYLNKKYGITKSEFYKGRSFKIYAQELGGNNFVSLNYYQTRTEEFLKPCEVPEDKIIHFLNHIQTIS